MRGKPDRLSYLGWTGYGNVGDEAIYQAYREAFPTTPIEPLPPSPILRVIAIRPGVFGRALLLGGGTLIGHQAYRVAIETVMDAAPSLPCLTIGAGVEDPAFFSPREREVVSELKRWKRSLGSFTAFSVRGFRSQQLLADIGLQARVVGDPALLVAVRKGVCREEGTLGVNIGQATALYGGNPVSLIDAVVGLCTEVIRRGWRVRLIPMGPRDISYLREIQSRTEGRCQWARSPWEVRSIAASLASCDIVVGQKLHSLVLASGSAVPSIALEYHPKCSDFQSSIGMERFCLRTDKLDFSMLIDLFDEVAGRRQEISRHLRHRVDVLRDALSNEIALLRAVISDS